MLKCSDNEQVVNGLLSATDHTEFGNPVSSADWVPKY